MALIQWNCLNLDAYLYYLEYITDISTSFSSSTEYTRYKKNPKPRRKIYTPKIIFYSYYKNSQKKGICSISKNTTLLYTRKNQRRTKKNIIYERKTYISTSILYHISSYYKFYRNILYKHSTSISYRILNIS